MGIKPFEAKFALDCRLKRVLVKMVLREILAKKDRREPSPRQRASPRQVWARPAHEAADVRENKPAFAGARYFLLLGLWPAGVLPDANGDGAAPPFLRFLSAFGFFFSLLLRI